MMLACVDAEPIFQCRLGSCSFVFGARGQSGLEPSKAAFVLDDGEDVVLKKA